ncbi:MAG TPA: ABC transporter permease [Clostridiales bacterium]|nr:ABC transporter permease [Clostridiales bacterium]
MKKRTVKLSVAEQKQHNLEIIYKLLPILSFLILIGVWLLAASVENARFPSPTAVWERYLLLCEKPIKKIGLLGHVLTSLRRVFIAFAIAWSSGIAFGILTGWNKKMGAVLNPIFNAVRAVPPLAWIPLITIMFGTGEGPKILVVFIGAFMPVVVNTQAGMSNIKQLYLNVGTIFNANKYQRLFQIAIPSALDAIFAGLRTSVSSGWMVVLAAEMLGAKAGVGFLITRGMESGDQALVLISMICIGLVGALLAIVMQIMEGVICPWTRKK